MASALYPLFKHALQTKTIDMTADTIKAALMKVTSGYTYSGSDQFWSSAVASVIGTPVALTTKTDVAGVFDADDVTFTAVADPGFSAEAIILYKDTGTNSTSPLVAYIDSFSSGMPVRPNGGDILITWSNGGSKIYAL